jgi:hypothetical protein
MVPQVMNMVASEDPEKLEAFVTKTMGLCAYILKGDGAVISVTAYEMPREDQSAPSDADSSDQLRVDSDARAGEGAAAGGDRDGQDDARGDADLRLLQSLPDVANLDLGLETEVPG